MNKLKVVFFFLLLIHNLAFGQASFEHKVASGETMYAIARKYNTTVAVLYQLNPKLKDKTLQVNAVVKVPSKKEIEKDVSTTQEESVVSEFHTVTKGESFYSISKKYNLTLADLEALNPKIKPKKLKEGVVLKIVKEDPKNLGEQQETTVIVVDVNQENEEVIPKNIPLEIKDNASFTILHTIKRKETKYGVAKLYGISIRELEALNPNLPSDFPVGYELIIKKDAVNETTVASNTELSYEEEDAVDKMSKDFMSKADLLVEKASEYIGIRYKYGGDTPKGFDCSGLMCTTFKEIDLSLPRTSSAQATYGEKVKMKDSQKGDLIFFATGRKNRISHVGLITEVNEDEIKFIHASTSSGVMISSSKEPYYASRIIQVNRVLNQ
ncbi:LysM peptidoglycan-binding domain-containing protein [Flavobacterium sp. TP390]|uniref:LysM peptidoglycan-binding domain-containing protein n=1 Tax=Flavobacterium profundi TaxID=1774945 RepID=A0A6I4IUH3_9FLAO|nr:peptidoglycan endopeptidase [Flavobacterium profundi]MVO10455.1 LysM peptidoglycan-binding domain-containing protein [Flavobacterium profundi]